MIYTILEDWLKGNFDKEKYFILSENDKNRFVAEVEEFENFGYYSKNID